MASYGYGGSSKSVDSTTRLSSEARNQNATDARRRTKSLKVPQKEILIFFRQLAVILQSGIPLAQGMSLLAENMNNKQFNQCINDISSRLNSGEDLSACLMLYPKVFKPITIGLIEAGEVGGILEEVLDRIARLMEQQAKLKSQITGALIYPGIVLSLAISVGLALLVFIVPRFESMFASLGAKLPALTVFMLSLSRLVTNPSVIGLTTIGVTGGSFLFRQYYSSPMGRRTVDGLIFRIPLFGDLLLKYEMASLSETLSTLVNSGIPIIDGLGRCINASSNQIIRDCLSRGIQLAQQGQPLNVSLSNKQEIPKLFIAMVKIGEETGELPFMLENLATFYNREIENTVGAITKAMEPTTVLLVAGIVGTIVVSLYLPMFEMIRAFKK